MSETRAMQSDVFEDFASDDAFESDFDDDDDDDDDDEFSDEQITNVLDLMAESSMARLDTVFQEDASKQLKEDGDGSVAVTAATKEAESGCPATDVRPRPHVQDEERARETRDELVLAPTAPIASDAPSMLSLLEELFPPLPRPSLDILVTSINVPVAEGKAQYPVKETQEKQFQYEERYDIATPTAQPEWLRLLDDAFPSAVEAQSTPPPNPGTATDASVAEAQTLAVGTKAPTLQEEAKPNEQQQPEWMRVLLDSMLAGSTKPPYLSPIAEELTDHFIDDFVESPKRISTVKSSPGEKEKQQPSWTSLLNELYPSSTEAQSPAMTTCSHQVTDFSSAYDQEATEQAPSTQSDEETHRSPLFAESQKTKPADEDSAQDPLMSALHLDSTQLPAREHQYGEPSVSTSLDGNLSCSSAITWGRFSPDRMPVRHVSESLSLVKTSKKQQQQATTNKRLCYIPLCRSQKRCRVRSRVITPAESELTFRPKINRHYLKRLRSRRQVLIDAFSRRMAKDIQQRQERKIEREKAKEEQAKVDESARLPPKSLIAKGSARILQRNGLWEESLEKRLKRLMHGQRSGGVRAQQRSHKEIEKSRLRRQKRKQRAEAVASQACESLYQRGLDKKRHDQKRQQETSKSLKRVSARPKMTPQSQLVMKKKIRHELELVCGSRRRGNSLSSQQSTTFKSDTTVDEYGSSLPAKVKRISFVEFSCALLYFGLVPDLETSWKGDEKITLLWYVWRTFVSERCEDSQEEQDGEMMLMNTLESILSAVMLGEKETNGRQCHQFTSKLGNELFQVLRLNYLSRKRSQTLEVRKMYDTNSKSTTNFRKMEQTQSSRPRVPSTYTLHGKLVTRDGNVYDPLSQRQRATAAKVNELRRQKEEQEIAECTFQPRISTSRSQSSEWSCDLRLLSVYGRQYKTAASATKTTFDRLYNDAFQRQNNVLEKYFQARLEEDEQFKKEAAISPSYVNGLTVEERLHNLQAALANNPLPVNFYKKIDAMLSATELKAQESEAKARRLLPIQFQKSEDGRTIVVPFQFATDLRRAAAETASQVSSVRHHRSSGLDRELRKKTRALVHNAMNKLRSENELVGPEHEADVGIRSDQQQEEEATADFCLDVHLSPSEIRQLYFNANDDPALTKSAA